MRRIWREGVRTGMVIVASGAFALAPIFTGAEPRIVAGEPGGESRPMDQVQPDPVSSAPWTPSEGRDGDGQRAAEVRDRLHDSAKSFGEAILGGIKYAGRTVIGFFSGNQSK